MQTQRELDMFLAWYETAKHKNPQRELPAHGRLFRSGRRITSFGSGTVRLYDDALVFLRKHNPVWIWVLIVLGFLALLIGGALIELATGRMPIFLVGVPALALIFTATWLSKRGVNVADKQAAMKAASDRRSAFIPLSRVTGVETCVSSGLVNPRHLSVSYTDPFGLSMRIVIGTFYNSKVRLDAEQWERTIINCQNAHQHPWKGGV